MTKWLRADTVNLAHVAMNLGLTPDDAVQAIHAGARLIVMGYSPLDVRRMESDYREMRRKAYERGWGE